MKSNSNGLCLRISLNTATDEAGISPNSTMYSTENSGITTGSGGLPKCYVLPPCTARSSIPCSGQ